jgi:hypothetical protein
MRDTFRQSIAKRFSALAHSRSHGRRPARRLIGVLPPPRDLRSRDYRMVRWRHHERDDYPTVPMTLGNMRQLGIRSLAVIFSTCHHQAVVSADRWPDHVPGNRPIAAALRARS